MQRFLIIILLEGYAVFLALMQEMNGVRTDEAKYLLNIPYPHPPLVRWIIGQTEWMQTQEMFWRIIFATLLVQVIWVIFCLGRTRQEQIILGASWLLSAALWIEGGKILMAPLTAIQGLLFIFFLLKANTSTLRQSSGQAPLRAGSATSSLWIGLLWLASLFTAYQAVLFSPIVVAVFWRMNISVWKKFVYLGGPLVVLALYTLTNPLVIASMVSVSWQQVSVPLMERLGGVLDLWLVGGSAVVGVLGILGMIHARNIPLIASVVLVCVYIFFAHRAYYSVLFLPLFIGGLSLLLRESQIPVPRFMGLMVILCLILAVQHPLVRSPNLARQMMPHVPQEIGAGDILIAGTFGHEWQYGTHVPVRRYKPELLSKAQAAICLTPCVEIEWRWWKKLMDDPIPVYVPKTFPLPRGAVRERGNNTLDTNSQILEHHH